MDFTELDLAAVAKIQESKNVTPAKAKELFRQHVLKLANPDVENRAELVLESIGRDVAVATDEEVEEAVTKKKLTRNERRLAKKEKQAAKKAAKPKATKKAPKKPVVTREEIARVAPEREVELSTTEVPHVYTASLFSRKHVVNWQEINRTQGVAQRFNAVTMSNKRMDAAVKYAKAKDLPLAFCVTVKVLGKIDQGYAVSAELFHKFKHKQGPNWGFSLASAARKEYAESGWADCKFIEKAADTKAA